MRAYELVLVIKSSLSETDRTKLLDTIKGWLPEVKVTKEDAWGQKQLAYPIRKETTGYYQVFHLEGEKGVPADLEKRILSNEQVLRHLLVRRK